MAEEGGVFTGGTTGDNPRTVRFYGSVTVSEVQVAATCGSVQKTCTFDSVVDSTQNHKSTNEQFNSERYC